MRGRRANNCPAGVRLLAPLCDCDPTATLLASALLCPRARSLRGELTESDAFVTSHGATVSSIIEDHSVAHAGASGALSVAEMRSAAGRPSRL